MENVNSYFTGTLKQDKKSKITSDKVKIKNTLNVLNKNKKVKEMLKGLIS